MPALCRHGVVVPGKAFNVVPFAERVDLTQVKFLRDRDTIELVRRVP